MFDLPAEIQRVHAHLDALRAANSMEYRAEDPYGSYEIFGMSNYFLGIYDVIDAMAKDRPLDYPENAIETAIARRLDLPDSQFSITDEIERARAYYTMVTQSPHPTTPEELIVRVRTESILLGVIGGLNAALALQPLDYSALLPDSPEGLVTE